MALPIYQSSDIVGEVGVVRGNWQSPIAQGLSEIGTAAGIAARKQAAEQDAAAIAQAQDLGYSEGIMRDANGQLIAPTADYSTPATRARTQAAFTGYLAEFEIDARRKATEAAQANPFDATAFEASWAGATEGALAEVPPELRGQATIIMARIGSQTWGGILETTASRDYGNQQEAWKVQLNALGSDLSALARGGMTNSDPYRTASADYAGLIDDGVAAGFINEETAAIMKQQADGDGIAQAIAFEALQVFQTAGGGAAGYAAADEKIEEILTDPTLGIDEGRREQIAANARAAMRDHAAINDAAAQGIRDRAEPLFDAANQGLAVPVQDFYNLAAEAGRVGDVETQAKLLATAEHYVADRQFASLSLPDMEAAHARTVAAATAEVATTDPYKVIQSIENVTGDPAAIGDVGTPNGPSVGLGQIQLETARGIARSLNEPNVAGMNDAQLTEWLSNAENNERYGRALWNRLVAKYDGNVAMAAAAYNSGEGNVAAAIRQIGDPRTGAITTEAWAAAYPIASTSKYVQDFLGRVGAGYSSDAQVRAAREAEIMAAKSEAMQADPFGYGVALHNDALQLGVIPPINWTDFANVGKSLTGRLAAADTIAARENLASVLPVNAEETARLAQLMNEMTGPDLTTLFGEIEGAIGPDQFAALMAKTKEFGAAGEIVDLAPVYAFADQPSQSGFRRSLLQGSLLGTEELRKLYPSSGGESVASIIEETVQATLQPLTDTLPAEQASMFLKAATTVALYDGRRGDAEDAARRAAEAIASQYAIEETNGVGYRIPVRAADGTPMDPDAIAVGLDRLLTRIDQVGIAPLGTMVDPTLTAEFRTDEYVDAIREEGFWVVNGDETGVVLLDHRMEPVMLANGQPYMVIWEQALAAPAPALPGRGGGVVR